MFRHEITDRLLNRLNEGRRFIQVVSGPRQVGKTTAVLQVLDSLDLPHHYGSADHPGLREHGWIDAQWQAGRDKAKSGAAILVLDEVQKVTGWSEVVKARWDEDSRRRMPLKVVLLGSSPLLVTRGLGESLAGRFEIVRMSHWTLAEMHAGFGWDLDRFVLFGGYPGAAPLAGDSERWRRYILDSLIETTISRDILLMTRIDKPALLRRLFELGCAYSAQILSYNKMLGQLVEAGNTTTLSHYLLLLTGAGMLAGLQKFSRGTLRSKGSSPKLIALNTALMTALFKREPDDIRAEPQLWGRWVETAVGAHLFNGSSEGNYDVFYWRDPKGREVDFILARGKQTVAVEVKSGRDKGIRSGLSAFAAEFRPRRSVVVAEGAVSVAEFLRAPPAAWFET